jgi:hypothetical protein
MTVGILRKMTAQWRDGGIAIDYGLNLGQNAVPLNPIIGQHVSLHFTGKRNCIACGRDVKKTFQQGYCFPCTQKLAETDLCIVKPELCHHHAGTCRDDAFARMHCFIPHVVYLAVSSGAKVGITRSHQKLTRWADQGATAAIDLAVVPDRKTAGFMEIEIAKSLPDKTNWRLMLSGTAPETDLIALKSEVVGKLPQDFRRYVTDTSEITRLTYPVLEYPAKINSYNFDKNPLIDDRLTGIKGQYLMFSRGVINVRKYQGYEIDFSTSPA